MLAQVRPSSELSEKVAFTLPTGIITTTPCTRICNVKPATQKAKQSKTHEINKDDSQKIEKNNGDEGSKGMCHCNFKKISATATLQLQVYI